MIRIIKITGRNEGARRDRLERIERWMGRSGWRLADYADEARSAVFERPERAPRLPRLDPTRWAPGPDPWKPREWLHALRADARLLVVPGLVVALVLAVVLPRLPAPQVPLEASREAAEEDWFYVNASQLNVRGGPGTEHQVVGVLYRNQRVLVEERTDGWARIVSPQWGYVAASYLSDHPLQ